MVRKLDCIICRKITINGCELLTTLRENGASESVIADKDNLIGYMRRWKVLNVYFSSRNEINYQEHLRLFGMAKWGDDKEVRESSPEE